MLNRRQLLTRTLQGSALLSLGSVVPQFVANTAAAAEKGKENILVVIELNGGNDGLNTVIPHGDDLYHKYRPTLRQTKEQVVKITDHIGIHPGLRALEPMLSNLAIVQGVGYPNPDRSHFESMDIWQTADPRRKTPAGWLARSSSQLGDVRGGIAMMNIGDKRLPRALEGTNSGAISINNKMPYRLDLGGGTAEQQKARRSLLEDLGTVEGTADDSSMLQFVQRRQVQTLSTIDRLQELLRSVNRQEQFYIDRFYNARSLPAKLNLIAQLIQKDFGTRVFYCMRDDFDTHSNQAETHRGLMQEIGAGITTLFNQLRQSGDDKRVRVLTYSEFGRRVKENDSKGTDHGAASHNFVIGPSVKGGLIGEHPSLQKLDDGDLIFHTDFRRVYASLLEGWLGINSETVLMGKFQPLPQLMEKV
jgi:uncharacterized protein (DUF1501 family)